MKRLLAGAFALLFLCSAAPRHAAPADPNVLRATLPNGLRVVIVRNRLAPVVSTAVNYLAGGDETPKGFPGTAHAQEHMMFRGSPGLTADQLANIGSVMGGNFNANTRESITQYLFTVPSEDLDVALRIEAVRMQGVLDSKEDWDKERGAIEQEVAQDFSNPSYLLFEKLRTKLFAGTPYEHVALGTRRASTSRRRRCSRNSTTHGTRPTTRSSSSPATSSRRARSPRCARCSGRSGRSACPPAPRSFRAAASLVVQHGHRPLQRQQRHRHAHAGHRQSRFPGARSLGRRARQPPLRALRDGAAGQSSRY